MILNSERGSLVTKEFLDEELVCGLREDPSESGLVLLKQMTNYYKGKSMCEMLGGTMVSWPQEEMFKKIHTQSIPNLGSDKCDSYWTAIEYDDGVWKASYTREEQKKFTWGAGQPNGFEKENGAYTQSCMFVVVDMEGLFDTVCDFKGACSICEIPERVEFTLRGLNPKQLKMDKKYTLYPQLQDNSKNFLILEGDQNNKMEIQFHCHRCSGRGSLVGHKLAGTLRLLNYLPFVGNNKKNP